MLQKQSSQGFSLVELMIYLLIAGIILAVGVPAYFGYVESARNKTTRQNLQLLKQNINLYQIEFSKYPSRLEDLVERPKGDIGKNWHQFIEKMPKDGWNYDFYYRVTAGSKYPYELYSYGGSAGPEEPEDKKINVWDL